MNKVLGRLPDLGEELALCHLDAMCKDIQKMYSPGAQVNVASDGVLFNGGSINQSRIAFSSCLPLLHQISLELPTKILGTTEKHYRPSYLKKA